MLRRLVGDHLTFAVATTRPLPLVVADRSQMEQVVMNLVLNARDATARRRPHHAADRDAGDLGRGGRARAPRPVRRVRLGVGRRHRLRHVERRDGPGLRALLHDQAEGQRHRPGPGHGLRQRGPERRVHARPQRAGRGHHDDRAPAALRRALARPARAARRAHGGRRYGACAGGRGRAVGPPLRQRRAVALRLPDHGRRDADRGARADGPAGADLQPAAHRRRAARDERHAPGAARRQAAARAARRLHVGAHRSSRRARRPPGRGGPAAQAVSPDELARVVRRGLDAA